MAKRDPKTKGGSSGTVRARRPKPEYIEDWDQYFYAIARAVAQKSKDPNCQVGAVIVSEEKLVLATGFNGLARGVFDTEQLLGDVEEKLKWICHAETNAIFNVARTGVSVKGCTMFVTKFPCFPCCNAIVQAGLTRIYTLDDKYWDDDEVDGKGCEHPHTRKPALLKQAGIQVDAPRHFAFNAKWKILLEPPAPYGGAIVRPVRDDQPLLPGTSDAPVPRRGKGPAKMGSSRSRSRRSGASRQRRTL